MFAHRQHASRAAGDADISKLIGHDPHPEVRARPHAMSPAGLLGLQRSAGNEAVASLLSERANQRITLQRGRDEQTPPAAPPKATSPTMTASVAFANAFTSAIPRFFTNLQVGVERTGRVWSGDAQVADENRDIGRLIRASLTAVIPVGTHFTELLGPGLRIYEQLPDSARAQVHTAAGSGLGALLGGQAMAWATNKTIVRAARTVMLPKTARLLGIVAAAQVSWLNFQAASAGTAGHIAELRSNPVTRPLAEAVLPQRSARPDI